MRLTKSQLKRIIREEYAMLKRRGLIREMSGYGDDSDFGGEYGPEPDADQLAHEIMMELPEGCSYDEVLEFALEMGYTQDDVDEALDIIAHQEKGW